MRGGQVHHLVGGTVSSPQAGAETLRDCAPWWPLFIIASRGSQPWEADSPADQWLGLSGANFFPKARRAWEEGDSGWGKPTGQKAGKDTSVTLQQSLLSTYCVPGSMLDSPTQCSIRRAQLWEKLTQLGILGYLSTYYVPVLIA